MLDKRARKLGINPDITHPNTIQQMKMAIADEAMFAIENTENAVGWYDAKLKEAFDVIEHIHPELKTDPIARGMFNAFVAITSNGIDVIKNFELGDGLYQTWKTTGKINTKFKGGGKSSGAMKKSLRLMEEMIAQDGAESMFEFFGSSKTVGEIQKATGIKVSGEKVPTVVRGSMVLGPKIGSFFNNLNGDYSTVTMDRWFMRTVERMTGTLAEGQVRKLPNQVNTLLERLPQRGKTDGVLNSKIKRQVKKLQRDAKKLPLRSELIQENKEVVDFLVGQYNKMSRESFKHQTPLKNAFKNMYVSISALNEAPKNGTHRVDIRNVMESAQAELQKRGVNISNADLQAVLWFYEKQLYGKLGYQFKRAESADYADAARSLAKRYGDGSASKPQSLARAGGSKRGTGELAGTAEAVSRFMPAFGETAVTPQGKVWSNGQSTVMQKTGSNRLRVIDREGRLMGVVKNFEEVAKLLHSKRAK